MAGKSPRCFAVLTPSPTEKPLRIAVFAFLIPVEESLDVIIDTFLSET